MTDLDRYLSEHPDATGHELTALGLLGGESWTERRMRHMTAEERARAEQWAAELRADPVARAELAAKVREALRRFGADR